MRPIKIFIFYIFSICATMVQAQTNFLQGYYITLSQDTIHGFISYRSEKRNSTQCLFKPDLNSSLLRFYPKDIKGFSIQSTEFFESFSIKTRKGEDVIGFFKVIVRGQLSLLRYESRYFMKTEKGDLVEITKRKIIEDGHSKTDYHGLGMLKVTMKNCPDITTPFLEKEYQSTPDFKSIFIKYNQCIGSKIFEGTKIKILPHIDAGIVISPALSSLYLGSALENAKFNNQFGLTGGGFVSIFLPKVNDNIRLVAEASFGKQNLYSYYQSDLTNNDLFIDYSYLKTPLIIRYLHNKIFFDIGIQHQFIISQNLKWRMENITQNTVITENGTITPLTSSNGILAGIGLQSKFYNHIVRSSLRFSRSQSSKHPNKPIYQSVELMVSIQLTK